MVRLVKMNRLEKELARKGLKMVGAPAKRRRRRKAKAGRPKLRAVG
jgi:hypothetical protein